MINVKEDEEGHAKLIENVSLNLKFGVIAFKILKKKYVHQLT